MYVFELEDEHGVLAEEVFAPQECDKEEYGRIFRFRSAEELAKTKKSVMELQE
jgi:hypothetical protein